MIGLALLGIGAVLLWAAFTRRGDAVIHALQMDLSSGVGFDPNAAIDSLSKQIGDLGGSGGSGGSGGGSGGTDSGTHAAIDANGNVYTINKSYGDMTDTEKDDANRFAHNQDNLASSAQ